MESNFIYKVVDEAKIMGVEEIYLNHENKLKQHGVLKYISLEDIDNHPFFNNKILCLCEYPFISS